MFPVTLQQVKRQCEVDDDITTHDTWFNEAIAEAQDVIEGMLQSTLTETYYQLTGDAWPCDGKILLPMGPILSVIGISYLDRDGNRQSLDPASAYTTVLGGRSGYVIPAWNTSWPYARWTADSVSVEYSAGYQGAGSPGDASGVPKGIVRGMKMLVAHWFENREAILQGTISKEIEMGLRDVIQAYRNYP